MLTQECNEPDSSIAAPEIHIHDDIDLPMAKKQQSESEWWLRSQPTRLECPVCLHEYGRKELTKHHLIPKSRGGKETALICKPCHKQIHAVYSEKELEQRYGTLDDLLEAPEYVSWVKWIRKHPPRKRIRTKTSRRRRR